MDALPFVKMHGCGNDFVVLDGRRAPVELTARQIRRVADRRKGVGFDQFVVLEPAAGGADVSLRFFNSDGSAAGACGNGTRCAARLLFEEGAGERIEIAVGDRRLGAERLADGRIGVRMGEPTFAWREIPLAEACDALAVPVDMPGLPRPAAVGMGNPHAVFFVPELAGVDVARVGAEVQAHRMFPEGANVGFAQVVAEGTLRLRVFERGAGLTLACGSGACAAMAAARRRGLVGDRARLILDGGELEIAWPGEGAVTMTGPTAKVFSGTLAPELLDDAG
jgi:diaminopimelate epimerase